MVIETSKLLIIRERLVAVDTIVSIVAIELIVLLSPL